MTRRRRDRSGTWWYDVQVDIPDRQDDRRHGPALIRRTIEFCAPYPVVQPVEGERYDVLDPPPPEERQRWLLAMSPHQDGWADFPLHRLDCAQAQGSERLLTDQEALSVLADPYTAVPYPVCRPDTVLSIVR